MRSIEYISAIILFNSNGGYPARRPGLEPGPITTGLCVCKSWSAIRFDNTHLWLWVPARVSNCALGRDDRGRAAARHIDTSRSVEEKRAVTKIPPDSSRPRPDQSAARRWLGVVGLVAMLTAMRLIYAGVLELRTDEAY